MFQYEGYIPQKPRQYKVGMNRYVLDYYGKADM